MSDVLRVCMCDREELRRWFLTQETELFKLVILLYVSYTMTLLYTGNLFCSIYFALNTSAKIKTSRHSCFPCFSLRNKGI